MLHQTIKLAEFLLYFNRLLFCPVSSLVALKIIHPY